MEANTNAEKDTTTETQALGKGKKAVSFAPGVKPPADIAAPKTDPADAKSEVKPPIDGVIGRLEIRKSGLVQMRLGDEILLDVSYFVKNDDSVKLKRLMIGHRCYSNIVSTTRYSLGSEDETA